MVKICKYKQVEAYLRHAIEQRLFNSHEKLPSIRELALALSVSKNTVIRAYQVLEAQGSVYAQPRSGYCVSPPPSSLEIREQTPRQVDLLSMSKDILANPIKHYEMSAGSAHPNIDSSAIRSLYAHIGRHSRKQTHIPSHYQLPPGNNQLVKQLAKLSQESGIFAQSRDIAITHGAQQAISLAFRALTQVGDIVAVESPCYFGTLLLIESLGLRVVEIPSHTITGIDLDALVDALQRWPIKALLLTPNFTNPTGALMPLLHRKMLLEKTSSLPIIEDDVFGYLGFNDPIASLKSLDNHDRVIYINSLSKTLDSRLRIGWIIAGQYMEKIDKILLSENMGSLNLIQSAVAEFLSSGQYKTHLAKMRRLYQYRQQTFTTMLNQAFNGQQGLQGQYHLCHPEGSFLNWLILPSHIDTYELYQQCLPKKISFLPGHLFATQHQFTHCIRFSVANLNDEKKWQPSLNLLAQMIAAQLK
ncbi:PLP-dependent aminotransferase family protein [Vibrio metschnikovii]|uniref:aminotransferase-like domain-containing protein n=1 Tax=Vibrio metschnikovii TaxID=28172 RepID=UPI001C30E586|nr:PLP-dependent aminotransferase family protein [Vibrio metschnikovii]